ncbi:hypothetical protein [Brevundimonas lenta]|uniref:FHA domain-containing protein n=1 Tax=Brevundimonas lenta TaxID=424796 RepID=A0A7W6NMJ3_9CAUL|nr:hypothetical protein [Brevundimonas lenta]MBB4081420.1 hypothetical protein [Brevundimonas lenta]
MIALLASAALLMQDPPSVQAEGDPVSPAPSVSVISERPSDPVEQQPIIVTPGPPATGPTKRNAQARPAGCRSLSFADANPDACGAKVIREPPTVSDAASVPQSRSVQVPAKTPVTAVPAKKVLVRPRSTVAAVVAAGVGVLLVTLLLGALVVRRRGGSGAGVRAVELIGPETIVLSPNDLIRGLRGPGKSRWRVRDGRLILAGPTGSLLNGVPLDRTGDVVSTGDTVRLAGADYRVRII